MKYSECNAREQKAWKNIKYAASWHIFGLLNGCLDGSEYYEDFMAELENLDALINTVYHESLNTIYTESGCYFGEAAQLMLNDIRFCGREFLMKVVTHYCKKYQAEAIAELN